MQPELDLEAQLIFFSLHSVWILQLVSSVYTEIRINVNHFAFFRKEFYHLYLEEVRF